MDTKTRQEILGLCYVSPMYFINNFVQIYDSKTSEWIPFKLWKFQLEMANELHNNNLVAVLKARQLGATWVALAYILWRILFRPNSSVLVVSRREEESKYLLSDERLRGMYNRLDPMFTDGISAKGNKLRLVLPNASVVRAIPSNRGDSYTGQIVFADEFDLVQDQQKLLLAVRPVVSAGGKLILVSKSNKAFPNSPFKQIWKSGWNGKSKWRSLFYPWDARPDRDAMWYANMRAESFAQTGTHDALYENFPQTPEQALAPYEQDKRFPYALIQPCYIPTYPIDNDTVFVDGTEVYRDPDAVGRYVIGVDPAEGNPTSDYSVAIVMDKASGEEVAVFRRKIEVSEFGNKVAQLSAAYNNAPVLIERNNHGHSLIRWMRDNTSVNLLRGDDGKFGFITTNKSKVNLFSQLANDFIDMNVTIRGDKTFGEISNITGSTLSAPRGLHDDLAIAFALAAYARRPKRKGKRRIARTYSTGRRLW